MASLLGELVDIRNPLVLRSERLKVSTIICVSEVERMLNLHYVEITFNLIRLFNSIFVPGGEKCITHELRAFAKTRQINFATKRSKDHKIHNSQMISNRTEMLEYEKLIILRIPYIENINPSNKSQPTKRTKISNVSVRLNYHQEKSYIIQQGWKMQGYTMRQGSTQNSRRIIHSENLQQKTSYILSHSIANL